MTVTFTLTETDYVKMLQHFRKIDKTIRLKHWTAYLFPPLAAFIVVVLDGNYHLLSALIAALITALIWVPVNFLIKRGRIRRWFNQSNLHLIRSISLTDNGVNVVTPIADATISWAALTEVSEDPEFIHLRTHKNYVIFVPKRAFSCCTDAAAFVFKAQTFWMGHRRDPEFATKSV